MNKLFIENNGTKVPIAELEMISAKQQLLVGDVNRDLILRTAGSITVQVGNKFYNLPFTQDSGDTVINDSATNTLILDRTSELINRVEPEGTLVYVRESQILYLVVDGAFVRLISTKSGSVYADLSAFEDLNGDQRYTLQLYLGLTLAKLEDVLTYNFDQFYSGQTIYFIQEGKHLRHIYGTDPRNPSNWQELYLSVDGGSVLGNVGIGGEVDPNYKLSVKGKAAFDSAVTLRDGFVHTNYKAGNDGTGYRLYSDFTGKWTFDLDRLTIRHSMSTPGFVSGFSGFGFRLDVENSHLIIDNLTVRKQMKVYELVISQIRASNGSIWVSDAAKISEVQVVANGYRCFIDTDEGTIIQPFRVNDIIRCQKWNGKGVKYYSSSVVEIDNAGEWFTISMDSEHEGDGVPEVGDDVVRIGNKTDTNRQGAIYLTSSDDYAPYIDVIDGVTSPSFADKTRVRLGKLSGITDPALGQLEGYGLYSDNVYLKGKFVITGGNAATKDDLANIIVGGRNLYGKTVSLMSAWQGASIQEQSSNGFKITGVNANNGVVRINNVFRENGIYTISFDAKVAAIEWYTTKIDFCDTNDKSLVFYTQFTHYSFTVNITNYSSETYNFIDFEGLSGQLYEFKNFKVEKGNKETDWTQAPEDTQAEIDDAREYIEGIRDDLQEQIDGQIESYFQQVDPTLFNYPASSWDTESKKQAHANDTYTNTSTGASWRWQKVGNDWNWGVISDTATQEALRIAGLAKDTADGKRRVFTVTPYPPYDIGDLWSQGPNGDLMVAVVKKTPPQQYVSSDWVKASKYTDDAVANGAVTLANQAINAANTYDANFQTFKTSLGDLAYEDLVQISKLGTTVIEGGYIKTQLLDVNWIKAQIINAQQIVVDGWNGSAVANSVNTAINNAANSVVEFARLGSTIIQGGYIKTNLIDVETIRAEIIDAIAITADMINALTLTVTKGTIGGLVIENNSIHSSNGKFSVTSDGVLTATDGIFTGTINSTSGSIGGWTLEDNRLSTTIVRVDGQAQKTYQMYLDSASARIDMQGPVIGNASWLSPSGFVMLAGDGEFMSAYGFSTAGFFRINGETSIINKSMVVGLYSSVVSGYGYAARFDGDIIVNGNIETRSGNQVKTKVVQGDYTVTDEGAIILINNDGIITLPSNPVNGRTLTINRTHSAVLRARGSGKRIRIRGTVSEAGVPTENLWGATFTYAAEINEWIASGYLN